MNFYERTTIRINLRRLQNRFKINWYKNRIRCLKSQRDAEQEIKQLKEEINKLKIENDNLQANKVLLSL